LTGETIDVMDCDLKMIAELKIPDVEVWPDVRLPPTAALIGAEAPPGWKGASPNRVFFVQNVIISSHPNCFIVGLPQFRHGDDQFSVGSVRFDLKQKTALHVAGFGP